MEIKLNNLGGARTVYGAPLLGGGGVFFCVVFVFFVDEESFLSGYIVET